MTAAVLALALAGCDQQQQGAAPPASSAPASGATPGMPMPGQAGQGQVYTTTGQVTEVAADAVTISHQPVPALNWPAMTMTFKAPDAGMVTGLRNGSAVEFSFRQDGSQNVLTEIKPR
jgi:Cu(I)/Ag(I) efflux system membrane fusion protein